MDLIRSKFLNSIEWPKSCLQAFEYIPNVYFWVKDSSGCFAMANQKFIEMCGKKTLNSLLGRSDNEVWPKYLAEGYIKDDQMVMGSGKSIVNRIELILNSDGSTRWFSTTKIPLYNNSKKIVGVMGYAMDLKKTDVNLQPVLKMAPALDVIASRYMEPLGINDLAKVMGLSLSAFERQFKKTFNKTPIQYLNQIRIDAACHLLVNSDATISEIAMKTGFYDQSHFSKRFFKDKGRYPGEYRKTHSIS